MKTRLCCWLRSKLSISSFSLIAVSDLLWLCSFFLCVVVDCFARWPHCIRETRRCVAKKVWDFMRELSSLSCGGFNCCRGSADQQRMLGVEKPIESRNEEFQFFQSHRHIIHAAIPRPSQDCHFLFFADSRKLPERMRMRLDEAHLKRLWQVVRKTAIKNKSFFEFIQLLGRLHVAVVERLENRARRE